jgi:hypothetical protein
VAFPGPTGRVGHPDLTQNIGQTRPFPAHKGRIGHPDLTQNIGQTCYADLAKLANAVEHDLAARRAPAPNTTREETDTLATIS